MSTQDNEGKAIGFLESISTNIRELLDLAKTPRKNEPAEDPPSPRARKVKDDPPADPAAPAKTNEPPQPPPPADPPQPQTEKKPFLVRLLGG